MAGITPCHFIVMWGLLLLVDGSCACTDSQAEWIVCIEDQVGFRRDMGRAGDGWIDSPILHAYRALEHAAYDAFLPPDLPHIEFAIRIQAGHFGAGAGAAGGAIIGLARTQHEILAVDASLLRRPEQFDVVDLVAVVTTYPLALQGQADLPAIVSELLNPIGRQFHPH